MMVCLLQMMQLDNTNMYYPYLCWHLWCKGHSCDDLCTTLVCAGIFGAIDTVGMWTLLGFVCWEQMMMISKQTYHICGASNVSMMMYVQTYHIVCVGVWCKQCDYDVVCTDLLCCLHWCVWCKQCDYHDMAVNPFWE